MCKQWTEMIIKNEGTLRWPYANELINGILTEVQMREEKRMADVQDFEVKKKIMQNMLQLWELMFKIADIGADDEMLNYDDIVNPNMI